MDYKQFLAHTCTLEKNEDIVELNTPPGFMYTTRIWLRRWTMSSDTDQLSRMLLKSDYVLRLDRKRQYNLYFYTIHPLSEAASFFERFYMVLYMISLFCYPFTISFTFKPIIYVNVIADLLFSTKIAISCVKGYISDTDKEVVLDRRLILKRYLKSYFIIDLLATIPMNFIMYLLNKHDVVTPLLRATRLVRSITVLKYVKAQHLRRGYPEIVSKIFQIFLLYVHFIWCGAAAVLVFTILTAISQGGVDDYLGIPFVFWKCLFKATILILLVTNGSVHDRSINLPVTWHILLHFVGLIFALEIITRVLSIVSMTNSTELKFRVLLNELKNYVSYKKLTKHTHERLETYYRFRYQQHFYNEPLIKSVLSEHLQKEVQVFCAKKYVQLVDLFADLPSDIIVELTLACQIDYYLKNDIIMENGVPCDSLIMISAGTCALYDNSGKEFCHLEDNCYIGEMMLIFNVEANMPTTIAISSCEVYVLQKKVFEQLMKPHKAAMKNIYNTAQDKLQRCMHVMQQHGFDFIPPQVLIDECLASK